MSAAQVLASHLVNPKHALSKHLMHSHTAALETESVIQGLRVLANIADAHQRRFRRPISEDAYLGDECWFLALKAFRGMLNGETGGLDCGTVDAAIIALAIYVGYPEHDL